MSPSSQKISRTQRSFILTGYIATTAAALAMTAAAIAAPWLASRHLGLAAQIYRSYARICHQDPARCLTLAGYPLAACGRCLGIYAGFLAGCVAYPFFRSLAEARLPRPRTFILMSIPLGADAMANMLGLWDLGNWFRLATGSLWGFILPFYFLAGLSGLILGRLAFRRPSP